MRAATCLCAFHDHHVSPWVPGVLLGDDPIDDDALPLPTLVTASALLLVTLPWLV